MTRPRVIELATASFLLGLAVGLVNTVRLWSVVEGQSGLPLTLVVVLLPTILFLSLTYFVRRRRNWARMLMAVLVALSLPGYFRTITTEVWGLTEAVQALNGVCFVAGCILLFTRDAGAWFRQPRAT